MKKSVVVKHLQQACQQQISGLLMVSWILIEEEY
jgi:hypothetical protein